MMNYKLLFASLLLLSFAAMAVFEAPSPDPAAIGMADITPAIGPGPTSLFYESGIAAGSAFQRSLDFADFDHVSAWASWSQDRIGRISASFGTFSVPDISTETKISLGYTRSILSDIHTELNIAACGDVYSLSYGKSLGGIDLGSAAAFALDLGAEAIIYNRTRIRVLAENLTATNMGTEGDIEIPRAVSASIGYSPYNATDMVFHIRRETGVDYIYGLGISVSPHKMITFRLGAVTNPDRVTAGIGLKYKFVRFDYALKSHPALPISHAVSIGVDLER